MIKYNQISQEIYFYYFIAQFIKFINCTISHLYNLFHRQELKGYQLLVQQQKNHLFILIKEKKAMKNNNKKNPNSVILINNLHDHITPVSISTNSTHYHQHENSYKKSLNDHQNHDIVNSYLNSILNINKHSLSYSTALKYSSIINSSLQSSIMEGRIEVSNKQSNIKNLLNQPRLPTQQIKLLQKRTQAQIRSKKLQLLDPYQQTSIQKLKTQQNQEQLEQNIINMISNAVLSKEQHKKIIQRFKMSNKKNQQSRKQKLFQMEQRERSTSFEKQQREQQKRRKQIQLRRLSIEQKLTLRKQQHDRFIQQEKSTNKQFKQVKKKTFLHQNMQQKYKSEILLPILEEKKMKLKELRDFYKRYDISEIKKHEAQYLGRHSKSTEKEKSRSKEQSFQYNPPAKPKKLVEFLQEEYHMANLKLQEKKKILEQNKQKQFNFLSEIKLKFKPKIDSNKKQEIRQRLLSSKVEAKRQLSQRDLKQLGQRYFEQARTKIKSNHNRQNTQGNIILLTNSDMKQKSIMRNKQKTQNNDKSSRYQYENSFIPIDQKTNIQTQREYKIPTSVSRKSNNRIKIHETKKKEIRRIINSENLDREEKLQRLKVENQKINLIYKRREMFYKQNQDDHNTRQEAIGLLLNSIHTKMGMIEICSSSK